MGAAWERMIRVVKDCLNKTMGRSKLEYFEFLTLLSEIETAINSRPLTYIFSANDIVPLTPNAFLKLHSHSSYLLKYDDEKDPMWNHDISSRDNLLKSLKHINDKFEHFRERWYEEYLLSLRKFSRDLFQTDWSNRVRIGDVVLIQSPTKPRPYWQMGVVENLIEGDDGKV